MWSRHDSQSARIAAPHIRYTTGDESAPSAAVANVETPTHVSADHSKAPKAMARRDACAFVTVRGHRGRDAAYPWAVDVTEKTWEQEVIRRSDEQPVLVDFWADWCMPCHAVAPILEQIAEERNLTLVKVDYDQERELADLPAPVEAREQERGLYLRARNRQLVAHAVQRLAANRERRKGAVVGFGSGFRGWGNSPPQISSPSSSTDGPVAARAGAASPPGSPSAPSPPWEAAPVSAGGRPGSRSSAERSRSGDSASSGRLRALLST